MKRRNWILQNIIFKNQDYVTIEHLVKRDTLIKCGSLVYMEDPPPFGNSIPVGDIPFVEVLLKKYYGKTIAPIEVPEILRTREFSGDTFIIFTD